MVLAVCSARDKGMNGAFSFFCVGCNAVIEAELYTSIKRKMCRL